MSVMGEKQASQPSAFLFAEKEGVSSLRLLESAVNAKAAPKTHWFVLYDIDTAQAEERREGGDLKGEEEEKKGCNCTRRRKRRDYKRRGSNLESLLLLRRKERGPWTPRGSSGADVHDAVSAMRNRK